MKTIFEVIRPAPFGHIEILEAFPTSAKAQEFLIKLQEENISIRETAVTEEEFDFYGWN